jgi:hypothetical protein
MSILPIWDIYNLTVHASNNPLRTHHRFIHYHRKTIEQVTSGYDPISGKVRPGKFNLFLPRALGGLGFKPPVNLEFKVTKRQIAYASYCRQKIREDVEKNIIPHGYQVSLVPAGEDKIISPSRKRNTTLKLWPSTTPLPEGALDLQDYTISLPPLSTGYASNEEGLKIRTPSPRFLKEAFQGYNLRVLEKINVSKLLSYDYKVIEQGYAPPYVGDSLSDDTLE